MKQTKKWLAAVLITVVTGLALTAGLVVYVDPFFQYHKPLPRFPYLVDHQVNQNPGLAKNMEYEGILLGSSMTTSFHTNWFEEELGIKTQKLSYNGAYPKDQSVIMDIVFGAKEDSVKAVFMGIDEGTYSGDVNQTKFPLTDYLYDDFLWNDVPYLLNKDVILDYILRPIADPKDKSDWNCLYRPWWQDEHYNKASVLMYYEPAPEEEEPLPTEYFTDAVEANLAVNICPYIEAHPETEFYLFYPPYSILYWNDVVRRKELDAILRKLEYMTERLLEYDNVRLFTFQNNREIVCNLNNYADYTHYHENVCRYIVESFRNGGGELTKQNYKEQFADLREMAETYDYDAIYDDWYDAPPGLGREGDLE